MLLELVIVTVSLLVKFDTSPVIDTVDMVVSMVPVTLLPLELVIVTVSLLVKFDTSLVIDTVDMVVYGPCYIISTRISYSYRFVISKI